MPHRKALAVLLWFCTVGLAVGGLITYSSDPCGAQNTRAIVWEASGSGILAAGAIFASVAVRPVLAIPLAVVVGALVAGLVLFASIAGCVGGGARGGVGLGRCLGMSLGACLPVGRRSRFGFSCSWVAGLVSVA